MLILSRNKGQKIMVSDDIVISIIEVSGDQVRIGIEAPSHISIYREEIYTAIQQQNAMAASPLNDQVDQLLLQIPISKKK
ncbi:carbon storage regulator CsrA [Paenibacillus illinoisensis]|uniref:Translational regulator CsrA n=1 Tax=Paenibacillus illinoisensis TaxID=59845 RepID=A0A2W0CHQ6_9BACL|nr:carbon storage regulator CsrA [Paenibacillus illinoisensis]PYY29572.1 Carbon storage regulator [Paenibacillus illinoisensis]